MINGIWMLTKLAIIALLACWNAIIGRCAAMLGDGYKMVEIGVLSHLTIGAPPHEVVERYYPLA